MRHRGGGCERQRDTVDAVTKTRGLRTVVEDMALMTAAAPAVDLGADTAGNETSSGHYCVNSNHIMCLGAISIPSGLVRRKAG